MSSSSAIRSFYCITDMTLLVRVLILLAALILLVSCSTVQKKSPSQKSAERLVSFVETGDSTFLKGIFSDSVLKLMSIEGMVATREDFAQSLGELKSVDGPEFTSDSTAEVIMRYEEMSLVSSLEFNERGEIRFLSIRPEPVKSSGEIAADTNITDIARFADFSDAFNADTQFVRLVTILSPT